MSDEQPAPKKRARKTAAAKGAAKSNARKSSKASTGASAKAAPATPPVPVSAPISTSLIRVPLSVRWRDLDAFNHVNNSKFLSYLEEARLRWMLQLPGEWIDDNVAPVVAAAHVNYRRPIAWPNEVLVELFVERLGGTSLTIGHRIVHADDASVLYADGNVVMVWIDKQQGQPSPLPDAVRKACS